MAGSEEEEEERIASVDYSSTDQRVYWVFGYAGRGGSADADGAAGEAPVVAGRRRRGGGGWRGVVEVGAVGVQGQGGTDREEEDGGEGEGVRAARPRRGGVQAPCLHPTGAGRDGRSNPEGGGGDPEEDRRGEPSAQASRQDLRQEGEGIQRNPGGVQREEQGEGAACQQANRAGERK